MTLTVSIGGVAMTGDSHFIDENTASHVNAIGQRDTFTCRVVSKDGTYTPAIGASVQVSDDAGLRFGGSIRDKKTSQFGVGVVTEIQCSSWEAIFDRRYVGIQKSFVDTPAGDVFQWVFDNWLTFENLTASIVASGPNISVSFDWCTVREAFDLIAAQASSASDTFMWDCTAAKVTRFYKQTSFAAPINVSDASTDVMRPITINQSFGGSSVGYANKAYVRVSQLITEDRTNTFGPDGALTSFEFELPLAAVPTITLDTGSGPVAKTVGIRDVDTGKDFYWQDGSPEITAEVAPAAGSTLVVVARCYQTTVVDAGQIDDEVTARSIAEDNSGWYQILIDSSGKGTYADAVALGQAALAKYTSGPPRAVEYVTQVNGLKAGQHQTINLSGFGETINTTFIIESVTLFQVNTEYGFRVRAVNGALANGWLANIRSLASTGGGAVSGGGTIISTGNSLALTPALASGLVGVPYTGPLVATGGQPPYSFSIATGALPSWATLDPATGIISGTPDAVATTAFVARVTDASSVTADAACSMVVADAGVVLNVAPDNVTIDSVTPDPRPTPIVNGRGISRGTQRGVELRYTPPSPVGTFLGVSGIIEAPDQSGSDFVPLDGSVNLGGGRRLGGPKDGITIGPFAYADVGGSFRFSVPEPHTYPMTCRVRLMSYSDSIAADASTSPSMTFVITAPVGSDKPGSGTAYCQNPTGVTIIETSNPKRREGVLMRRVRVGMTPPADPKFAGVQWIVKDAAGETVCASGIQAETEFDLVFQELTAPQTCTVYACGSDGTNINPLVEGITPSATVDLGTIDGTVDLGETIASSIHPALEVVNKVLGPKAGGITEDLIATFAVSAAKIADGAVATAKIADLSVITSKLAAGAVDAAKLADLAVEAAKIAGGAVVNAKIFDGAVGTSKLADLAVTTAKINDASINSAKIGTAAVGSAAIANLAVGTAHIQDAGITNAKIGNLAVSTGKIQDAAITTAKINNLAVTTALIADAAITFAKIGTLAVQTGHIADAAITTAKIADAQITTAKIGDAQITSAKIDTLAVGKITGWDGAALNVGTNGVLVQNGASSILLDSVGIYIGGGRTASSFTNGVIKMNNQQVVTYRQTGPGNASGWSDGTAQTWANNLLTALRAHGLIT